MEEQTQSSVNLEIPSRWRRFSAYFLDLIINLTLFGLIINLIIIIIKKTTLGNMLVGIEISNNDNNQLDIGKVLLRFGVFYSTISILLFFIINFLSVLFCRPFGYGATFTCIMDSNLGNNIIALIAFILLKIIYIPYIINVIEIFFKSPTFIDKRLGIIKIYKKSKKNNE